MVISYQIGNQAILQARTMALDLNAGRSVATQLATANLRRSALVDARQQALAVVQPKPLFAPILKLFGPRPTAPLIKQVHVPTLADAQAVLADKEEGLFSIPASQEEATIQVQALCAEWQNLVTQADANVDDYLHFKARLDTMLTAYPDDELIAIFSVMLKHPPVYIHSMDFAQFTHFDGYHENKDAVKARLNQSHFRNEVFEDYFTTLSGLYSYLLDKNLINDDFWLQNFLDLLPRSDQSHHLNLARLELLMVLAPELSPDVKTKICAKLVVLERHFKSDKKLRPLIAALIDDGLKTVGSDIFLVALSGQTFVDHDGALQILLYVSEHGQDLSFGAQKNVVEKLLPYLLHNQPRVRQKTRDNLSAILSRLSPAGQYLMLSEIRQLHQNECASQSDTILSAELDTFFEDLNDLVDVSHILTVFEDILNRSQQGEVSEPDFLGFVAVYQSQFSQIEKGHREAYIDLGFRLCGSAGNGLYGDWVEFLHAQGVAIEDLDQICRLPLPGKQSKHFEANIAVFATIERILHLVTPSERESLSTAWRQQIAQQFGIEINGQDLAHLMQEYILKCFTDAYTLTSLVNDEETDEAKQEWLRRHPKFGQKYKRHLDDKYFYTNFQRLVKIAGRDNNISLRLVIINMLGLAGDIKRINDVIYSNVFDVLLIHLIRLQIQQTSQYDQIQYLAQAYESLTGDKRKFQKIHGTITNPDDPLVQAALCYALLDIQDILPNDIAELLIALPPGEYTMGEDHSKQTNERPAHRVVLSAFYMMRDAVTNELFHKYNCDHNTEKPLNGDKKPVVYIDFNDAQGFADYMNKTYPVPGMKWRLPTEAEFEYAMRGPNQSEVDVVSRYKVNYERSRSNEVTAAVDDPRYEPNGWGLRHIRGNVWEWVQDWFAGYPVGQEYVINPSGPNKSKYRVIRGGSWTSNSEDLRLAIRGKNGAQHTGQIDLGFRLVLARENS